MPFASRSAPYPPCSLPLQPSPPSHSASLMPSILCRSAAHRQPLSSAHSSAALAPCCQLGTRRDPIPIRAFVLLLCERSNMMTIL